MKEKQTTKVLRHMEEYGCITDDDARRMRIKRLSARIYDLRKKGHNIVTTMISAKDEDGVYCYASYRRAPE